MFQDVEFFKNKINEGGYVGLAQINPIAGNLEYNANKIREYLSKAEEVGLDIIIFPEFALIGCEMKDFTNRFPFILDEEIKYLEKIAKLTQRTTAVVGFVDKDNESSFAILRWGRIDKFIKKSEYFTSKLLNDGVEYLIRPVSIPSTSHSEYYRKLYLQDLSKQTRRAVVEVNQVGAIDNDSYAGLSCVYDENGELIARAKDFSEQLLIVNPFRKIGKIYNDYFPVPPKEFTLDYEWDLERTYKTLVQGIRDYFSKCGLKRAVLGLSGGLDSTVNAVLLVDALGKENVYGVSMPSKLTSQESKTDAKELAKNLGIGFSTHSIKPMFETTNDCLGNLFNDVEKTWDGRYKESFTPDNIQARSRAIYLWGIANEFSSCIPIATSDKSEAYMGYATINGDMSGGFAPILDVTKTKLFALARWINKNRGVNNEGVNNGVKNVIPDSVLTKPPGAELAIDPKTGKTLCAEDALMPYEFLDEIIWRIENRNESYKDLMEAEFVYEKKNNISKEQKVEWLDKFYRRMSFALYKGYIMPPSIIVEAQNNNKTKYFQPITSSGINYKNL